MKLIFILPLLLILLFQSACGPLKYKKVSAKDFPADPKQRVEKNMNEGRGFRLSDLNKSNNTTYSFASSNPLWKATLEILDFMPLVSANYSGGIIITDWYTEGDNLDESVKISIRFLTNEVRADSLDIKVFNRRCINTSNCVVKELDDELGPELKKQILKKATLYKQEKKNKKIKN